jgi:hypothetical protein
MITPNLITGEIPPELEAEIDAMLLQLERLKRLRLIRNSARCQVREAAGVVLSVDQLDQFLVTGRLPQ